MITFTTSALDRLRRYGAGDDTFVRILVTSGGCAGMTYDAEIDRTMQTGEKVVFTVDDISVVTNNESQPYLYGLTVDYSDDLISAGFRFSNELNDSSCGCGASFTLSGFPEAAGGGLNCGS
ncbi:MAG: iron-sulfur cluster assembly accessory protein [Desulfocapsaceae bacterium]|jgi:iron-sulfur cluster assembly protein|nr:iron-sulfur cluster assembly accessory protein [Desulfocapsaceae bacterium]